MLAIYLSGNDGRRGQGRLVQWLSLLGFRCPGEVIVKRYRLRKPVRVFTLVPGCMICDHPHHQYEPCVVVYFPTNGISVLPQTDGKLINRSLVRFRHQERSSRQSP